ncbi:MAG: glycosyltransferase family 4 protein [Candidatus Pristimantibacillus sp.]
MNILTTGLGWNDQQPGGLNRYFVDYHTALASYGHSGQGFIIAERGNNLNTDLNITNTAAGLSQPHLISRMKSVRQHTLHALHSFHADVFNPHFALYATLVSRKMIPAHIPIVTHFHGPWALESKLEESQRHGAIRQSRYLIKKQIEQMNYRRSDRLIVLSEYFRGILTEQYGIDQEKIKIIPGAVEHERFIPHPDREGLRRQLGIGPEQKLLFCARRIVRRMGIDRLIEAMRAVVNSDPNVRLMIAGDGPMRLEYERLIEDLELTEQVKLLGRVSNEELVQWYQAADMSIVPTITLEGFGLVTVESLACGTPVLGTPYGGTKEILQKFSEALLFKDGTAEAMSDSILAVLNNRLMIPSREQCREHVLRHYTWGRVIDSVTDVFQEEVEKRRIYR